MKKLLLILAMSLGPALLCQAAGPQKDSLRHMFRFGWGDMLFERTAFHATSPHLFANPEALPENYAMRTTHDYKYTGHFFAEYQYRLARWFSIGFQADAEGIFWKETILDHALQPVGDPVASRNYNLVLMPTARVTWKRRAWGEIYSGLGAGVLLAMDNAPSVELAPAVNFNFLGVQVGKGHWGGALDLGMLSALKGANKVYMLGSRLVSVSVFYRW